MVGDIETDTATIQHFNEETIRERPPAGCGCAIAGESRKAAAI